jgi:hypothetical protein
VEVLDCEESTFASRNRRRQIDKQDDRLLCKYRSILVRLAFVKMASVLYNTAYLPSVWLYSSFIPFCLRIVWSALYFRHFALREFSKSVTTHLRPNTNHEYMKYVCMHACMYVCVCECMYVCMNAVMHICMYACLCVCTNVRMYGMYVCMYVCVRIWVCFWMYVHAYVGISIYAWKNVNVCIRMHTCKSVTYVYACIHVSRLHMYTHAHM